VTGRANRYHHAKRSDDRGTFFSKSKVNDEKCGLQGCILSSWCSILLTLRSEIPRAAACFLAERRGDCSIDALTVWTFSGVLTPWGQPGGFHFNVDPVALMFETYSRIVFRSRTGAHRPSLKCLRNALCVAITDSLFLKNVSTTKPRYSPDQPMALSENGKTTANQRDPSHHCTPSTALAVTPPNVGVISAAPCICINSLYYVTELTTY